MNRFDAAVASRLRGLRRRKYGARPGAISAAARALGVSCARLSTWEHGRARPRPEMLVALARHYGVTPDAILLGTPPPASP